MNPILFNNPFRRACVRLPWFLVGGVFLFWLLFGRTVDLAWEGWAMRARMIAGRMPAWSFTSAYGLWHPIFTCVGENLPLVNLVLLLCLAALGYWVGREA